MMDKAQKSLPSVLTCVKIHLSLSLSHKVQQSQQTLDEVTHILDRVLEDAIDGGPLCRNNDGEVGLDMTWKASNFHPFLDIAEKNFKSEDITSAMVQGPFGKQNIRIIDSAPIELSFSTKTFAELLGDTDRPRTVHGKIHHII
jgi:hypothetical protein